MNVWKEFENWRDEIHCGGSEPEEWFEAEIGTRYELWDAINQEVEETVICTPENKEMIERSLNDTDNDMWWYRKAA